MVDWGELEGVKNQEFTMSTKKEEIQSKEGGRCRMGHHILLWEFQNSKILEVTHLEMVALSSI